jgi:hypothetical protein
MWFGSKVVAGQAEKSPLHSYAHLSVYAQQFAVVRMHVSESDGESTGDSRVDMQLANVQALQTHCTSSI